MTAKRIAAALIAAALTSTAACGGDSDPAASADAVPEPISVSGTVLTEIDLVHLLDIGLKMDEDETYVKGDTRCRASRDSAGAAAGDQVVVRDADGTTVGTGVLSDGVLGGGANQAPMNSPCTFAFDIADVPGGGEFYSIQVGQSDEVTYRSDELTSPVELDLR